MALTQEQADAIAVGSAGPSRSGLGWDDLPDSMLGAGASAGLAGWQGGMGALAGALGFDTEDFVRRKEEEAAFYQRNAPGTTAFLGDEGVVGSGSLTDYMLYLTGQALPYAAEFAAGAATGGVGFAGTAGRMAGAKAIAEQAARNLGGKEAASAAAERTALELAKKQVGQRYAATAGGVAASYPSAVGDILTNQLEGGAAFDDMELGPAMVGGVPYALLNLLGGESAALKAATGGMRGVNLPAAMARGWGKAGVAEGAGETGQEMINQLAGQMAINPDKEFASPDALHRYAESFASGLFGPGGAIGAVAPVFSKPQVGTPEEIAARTDLLKNSIDLITGNHQTWLDLKEQTAKDIAEQQKQDEADEKEFTRIVETNKKEFDKRRDLERKAEDAKRKNDTEQLLSVREFLSDLKQPELRAQIDAADEEFRAARDAMIAGAHSELPIAPEEMARLRAADAEAKRKLEVLTAQLVPQQGDTGSFVSGLIRPDFELTPSGAEGVETPAAPATYEQVVAAARARGETLSTSEELYNALINGFNSRQAGRRAGPTAIETLAEEMLARRAAEDAAPAPVLNRPKPRPLRSAMEEALLGALKPLQEDAAWAKFIAEKEAQKQAEIDAAHTANPAAPKRDAKLIQGDLIGFENQAVAKPGTATEPAPNLADVNQWMTEGLQISADWAKARAAGDIKAMTALEKQAEAVYERAALGFPRLNDGKTVPMFDDAGKVPRAAAAATKKPFNRPKEKTDGAQAPQAKQAEPATPAVKEPAAAPATGAVKPDLNALLKAKIARDEAAPPAKPIVEPKPRRTATTVADLKDQAARAAEQKAEAEEEAKADAREAKAEAEVEAGPLGEAMRKLEDGADFEGSNGNLSKAKIKAYAKKLEKAGLIDDSELNDDGRDTDASELMDELGSKVEDAISEAVAERVAELEAEAEEDQAAQSKGKQNGPAKESPVPAEEADADADERQDADEKETLPELNAAWNRRTENRTRNEKAAQDGNDTFAKFYNDDFAGKFAYAELDYDLQQLVKHADEAREKAGNGRMQSKLTLDLVDRVEAEQARRKAEDEVAQPAEEVAPPVDPVVAAAEGIPKSLFSQVLVGYDDGKGRQEVKASAAMKAIKKRIDDYKAFIKCLGS